MFCVKCGEKQIEGSQFCTKCGSSANTGASETQSNAGEVGGGVHQPPAPPQAQPEAKGIMPKVKTAAFVLVVIIVAVFAFEFFSGGGSGNGDEPATLASTASAPTTPAAGTEQAQNAGVSEERIEQALETNGIERPTATPTTQQLIGRWVSEHHGDDQWMEFSPELLTTFDMWAGTWEWFWELEGSVLTTTVEWGDQMRYEVMLDGDRLSLLYLPEQELASPEVAEVFVRDDVQAYQQQDSSAPSISTGNGRVEWVEVPTLNTGGWNVTLEGYVRNVSNTALTISVDFIVFDENGLQLAADIATAVALGPGNMARISGATHPAAVSYEITGVRFAER